MWKSLFTALFIALALGQKTFAHPVIYKGGEVFNSNLSVSRQDFRVSHSFTSRFALGGNYSHIELKNREADYAWLQANLLAKRWNGESSQANIYLQTGLGGVFEDAATNPLGHFEAKADFETRRVYFALEHQSLVSTSPLTNHMSSATAGVAPYIVNYQGFHTWILARGTYSPQMDSDWSLSPGLRFFYRNFFAEIGSSLSGSVFLNLMVHL